MHPPTRSTEPHPRTPWGHFLTFPDKSRQGNGHPRQPLLTSLPESPHPADREAEGKRGEVTCPRSLVAGVSRPPPCPAERQPSQPTGSHHAWLVHTAAAAEALAHRRLACGEAGGCKLLQGGGPWQGTVRWLLKVDAGTQEDPHPAAWNCKANTLAPVECGEPCLHPPKVAALSWIKAEPGEFRDIEVFVLALPHPGCATWIKVSQPL